MTVRGTSPFSNQMAYTKKSHHRSKTECERRFAAINVTALRAVAQDFGLKSQDRVGAAVL